MSIREVINKSPGVVGAALLVGVIGAAAISIFGIRRTVPRHAIFPTHAFYSTDDGATYFTDDLNKQPPFDHNGQQAVRAYVFTCGNGAHQWVQYLEKFSDQSPARPASSLEPSARQVLVKKPRSGDWTVRGAPGCIEIMVPKCPDGCDPNTMEPLLPPS